MVGKNWNGACAGGGGAVYGIGLIGALIYYLQGAVGVGPILLGIIKSIIWPGLLVYKVFGLLNM